MADVAETKVCALCGLGNDPRVMLCANPSCAADLTFVAISRAPREVVGAEPAEATEPVCENGHAMVAGDELCLECGAGVALGAADAEPGPEEEIVTVPGCVLQEEIGEATASGVRRLRATHETFGEVRVTLYPEHYEPEGLKQERLAGLDFQHGLRLLAYSEAYEIWELGGVFEVDDFEMELLASGLARALMHLHEEGLIFRDLRPETIASRDGVVVLGDFSQAAVADFGTSLAPSEGRPYFIAPEAAVGAFGESSDWWSLGALLLHFLTDGASSPDVHDRAYLMQLVTRGIRVPSEGVEPMWQHLLKGLLTRDASRRWGGDEVLRWLEGERGIPIFYENDEGRAAAKALRLGGENYFAVAEWALAAAVEEHWDEAKHSLESGELGSWLAEGDADEIVLAELNRLRADGEIDGDERLALVLVLLNENQPLNYRGELVNSVWLLENQSQALIWLEGRFVDKLRRIERCGWFCQLAERGDRARGLVRELGIDVDRDGLRAAGLVVDGHILMQRWCRRRRDFPACEHRGLGAIAEKAAPSAEELVLLVSAKLDQFTPAVRILNEAAEEAERAGVAWDELAAGEHFRTSRREIFRTLNQRLGNFVRCGNERIDEWADSFRLDRRLSLARVLVVLGVPEGDWQPPLEQEYIRHLFDFFYRKILRGVQRGPLLALRVTKNSRNIDITELAETDAARDAVLDSVLARGTRPLAISPTLLLAEPVLERRLRRLAKAATDYERDTGIRSLYLGFPMLFLRPTSGSNTAKPKRAPLFLWSVNLMAGAGYRGRVQLAHDAERGGDFDTGGMELNPALQTLLKPEEVERLVDMLNEAAARTNLDARAFFELCAATLPAAECDGYEPGRLPSESPAVVYGGSKLVAAGAMFLCDFSQQTIAQDIKQLAGRSLQGGALKQALRLAEKSESEDAQEGGDEFSILPADPSQKKAIAAARRPEGLVVQGPPGTGKSQTISNIIADCLGRGETVLVVCQKQAALDVVGRRLAGEGLGSRFFMVVDSRRGREPIIRALRAQTEAKAKWRGSSGRSRRGDISDSIERLEADLSAYSDALWKEVASSGLSYAEVIDRLIDSREHRRISAYGLREQFSTMSDGAVKRVTDLATPLCRLWRESNYQRSPWHGLLDVSTDPETLGNLRNDVAEFVRAERVRGAHLTDGERIFFVRDPRALERWLRENVRVPERLDDQATRDAWQWRTLFADASGRGGISGLSADLDQLMQEMKGLDRSPMHLDFDAAVVDMSSVGFAKMRRDVAKVVAARTGIWRKLVGIPATGRVKKFLTEVCTTDDGDQEVDGLAAQLAFEKTRRRIVKRWSAMADRLGEAAGDRKAGMGELLRKVGAVRERIDRARLGAEAWLQCPQDSEFGSALESASATTVAEFFESAEISLRYVADCRSSHEVLATLGRWFSDEWIEAKRQAIDSAGETLGELGAMLESEGSVAAFLKFRPRFGQLAADERRVFEELEGYRGEVEGVPASEWEEAFRNTLRHEALSAWKGAAESREPALEMGRGEFESKVKALADATESLRVENGKLLKRPWQVEAIASATRWLEILKLRGANARRLREVLDVGADFGLFNLRPVWLSSPETVSRIFPLREGLFDVVIFDEASQMPVELAIPSLYRGRRAVVSGDRKQLPPTSFFSIAQVDGSDDDEDDLLLESGALFDDNLDEATRIRLQEKAQRREIKDCDDLLQLVEGELQNRLLTIHYRSQWRHLVEHSNAAFYGGRLSIPALNPDQLVLEHRPVEVRRIDGLYSDQVNPDEAEAVVEFLAEHWVRESPPSVGVVTFNMKQAELIEDLLEERMESDAEFRDRYTVERARQGFDAFFVKNLENVQGDERDWMVFSTTFGRNEKGGFIRNFGPLGQRGGERRLNVATTRAREKMVIFTSMPTAEIAEVMAGEGIAPRDYLKSYLSYSECVSRGDLGGAEAILERLVRGSGGDEAADRSMFAAVAERRAFVEDVAEFLEENGFEPVSGTANDAFHFDLALVDPGTGRYGLAIECDPPQHEDLDSAHAREIWRPAILSASIPLRLRVWSRLWLEDPDGEKKRLLELARGLR